MIMKLIIINGAPAAGKTTVAEKLHLDIPMSLLADVDAWRRLISGWSMNRAESLAYTYKFTIAAVEAHIKNKQSVIVDKAILSDTNVIDSLINIGNQNGAEVYEFILAADKDVIVNRANIRRSQRTERVWASTEQVIEFWNVTQKLITERTNAIVIDTSLLTPDMVYQKIKDIVKL